MVRPQEVKRVAGPRRAAASRFVPPYDPAGELIAFAHGHTGSAAVRQP